MKKYFAAAALLMMMAACAVLAVVDMTFNRCFGKYELKGKELELKNLGMTRMACPDMQYEDAFVKMLDEVDRFEIKGAELTLFDDHKALAVFKAVEKEPAKQ